MAISVRSLKRKRKKKLIFGTGTGAVEGHRLRARVKEISRKEVVVQASHNLVVRKGHKCDFLKNLMFWLYGEVRNCIFYL